MIEKFNTQTGRTLETIGIFYDQFDPESYDQMMAYIRANDPFKLIEVVSKPAPADTVTQDQDGYYGLLNVPREAKIFDMGQGTGIMGKLLRSQGFTNIEGADASENFVKVANSTGWYT